MSKNSRKRNALANQTPEEKEIKHEEKAEGRKQSPNPYEKANNTANTILVFIHSGVLKIIFAVILILAGLTGIISLVESVKATTDGNYRESFISLS